MVRGVAGGLVLGLGGRSGRIAAILSDRLGLEVLERLVATVRLVRVDGEHHALTAMVGRAGLAAVDPDRVLVVDGDFECGEVGRVGGYGHEPRVEASVVVAWVVECGLGGGVVLGVAGIYVLLVNEF